MVGSMSRRTWESSSNRKDVSCRFESCLQVTTGLNWFQGRYWFQLVYCGLNQFPGIYWFEPVETCWDQDMPITCNPVFLPTTASMQPMVWACNQASAESESFWPPCTPW